MLSTIVMLLLHRTGRFRLPVVSIVGGVVHNIGQILVAMIVLESSGVAYYMGVLWFSGMIAGALVGLIGAGVVSRLSGQNFE